MNDEHYFQDPIAEKIWRQYFNRLDRLLRPLDETQKRELTLEIKGHLLESFAADQTGAEAERLLNAIERLGEPEEFIRPMLADKLLTKASRTLSPGAVLKGLYYHLVSGARRVFFGILFVLGYLLAVCFALMAVLKVFFPKHVGILLFEKGDLVVGFAYDLKNLRTEVLGYWIIPIGLGLALILYLGLTKLLRKLKRKP
jgi:uncharacterized membrane protein